MADRPRPAILILRLATAGLATAAAVWAVTVALVLVAGSRPELQKADVILVLGAAQYNGRPSPVFKARLDHALALYREGYADRLVLTGGVGTGDTLSEGEVARRYVIGEGVPESAVLVEREGRTSAASVRAAAALMRAEGLESALLVSDPFHMLRLELLARRAGIRPYRAPAKRSLIAQAPRLHWRYVLRESLVFPATALLGGR